MKQLLIFYRWLCTRILNPVITRRLVTTERWEDHPRFESLHLGAPRAARIWFHAASVGELETLWTVIHSVLQKSDTEVTVTVFSESARGAIRKLWNECLSYGNRFNFAGYSPWEGEWGNALDVLKPTHFVTAKYEAWPELWASLSERKIPLWVVGARSRPAYAWARRFCLWVGTGIPALQFLTVLENDGAELRREFPHAKVKNLGDPRWDRVEERSRAGNPRAQELVALMKGAPRPWGVLGSVWMEDWAVIATSIRQYPGTLWLVPHDLSAPNQEQMRLALERDFGVIRDWVLSSKLNSSSEYSDMKNVWVDEMGFLAELYRSADWAYVGGGFGQGVHSVIEPAIHGLPIACGSAGTHRYSEFDQLSQSRQLTVVGNARGFEMWLKQATQNTPEQRADRRIEVKTFLGATSRVRDALFGF